MTISIWQVILILLILAVPAIPIALENSKKRLNNNEFISWIFFVVGANVISSVINNLTSGANPYISLALSLATLALIVIVWIGFSRAVVRRVRDAGMHKNYAYISVIPLIATVFIIFLLFKGSQPTDASEEVTTATDE